MGFKRRNIGAIGGVIGGVNEGVIEGVTEGVKERLVELLKAITYKEGERIPEYRILTGFPNSSFERYIKLLRDASLIQFMGDSPKTCGYFLTSGIKNY